MRLNRFLATAGLGSRRGVEELITQGSVRVNGQVVTNLATQILPTDSVKVGSRLIRAEQPIYAVLHKPPGYVCTAADEFERRTIFDLLPPNWPRVHHVVRHENEALAFQVEPADVMHARPVRREQIENRAALEFIGCRADVSRRLVQHGVDRLLGVDEPAADFHGIGRDDLRGEVRDDLAVYADAALCDEFFDATA